MSHLGYLMENLQYFAALDDHLVEVRPKEEIKDNPTSCTYIVNWGCEQGKNIRTNIIRTRLNSYT